MAVVVHSAEVFGLCGLAFGWAFVSGSIGGLQSLLYQQLVCREVLRLPPATCDSEHVPAAVTEETADRLATFVFCTQITMFATCTAWGKLSDLTSRRIGLLMPTVGLFINVLSFGVLRGLGLLLTANIVSGLLPIYFQFRSKTISLDPNPDFQSSHNGSQPIDLRLTDFSSIATTP
eukprot:SAG31_NODE_9417_length_1281_cov_1.441624_1_plen_176_part_00